MKENKIFDYEIASNKLIAPKMYEMVLSGPSSWVKPGMFIEIQVPGKLLRRPMCVCDYDDKTITIVYYLVGEGTNYMSKMLPGQKLNILYDLGNHFNIVDNKDIVLISGVCGLTSIHSLAKELKKLNKNFTVVLSFHDKSEVFYIDKFKKLTDNVIITTDNGSMGFKGNTIEALNYYNLLNHYYYACGSNRLMKAVATNCKNNGQLSLEARMGCGYGVCMGCSIHTKHGPKRICKEGPIFEGEDILWETID